jgi:hypothetical protein
MGENIGELMNGSIASPPFIDSSSRSRARSRSPIPRTAMARMNGEKNASSFSRTSASTARYAWVGGPSQLRERGHLVRTGIRIGGIALQTGPDPLEAMVGFAKADVGHAVGQ